MSTLRAARTVIAFCGVGAAILLATIGGTFAGDVRSTTASSAAQAAARGSRYRVTPVSGPSWLDHLHVSFDTTSMGRMGQNTPPPTVRYEPKWNQLAGSEDLNEGFVLSGSDLYRLDCESCHQPDGHGSPPEVHSLIEPVQAMSAPMMEDRMKKRGRPITPAMARQMADAAGAAIYDRLKHGGQQMPPFDHLEGAEVEALVAFLKQLAGVPGAEAHQIRVAEPFTRVGEHLVKGTCHICHAGTGPGTSPEALLRNVLPSLASFPREKTVFQVLTKVRHGAPVQVGDTSRGGRMPVFSYLTDDEVAAAYVYLLIYPPR